MITGYVISDRVNVMLAVKHIKVRDPGLKKKLSSRVSVVTLLSKIVFRIEDFLKYFVFFDYYEILREKN